jgi:hypothetical protein
MPIDNNTQRYLVSKPAYNLSRNFGRGTVMTFLSRYQIDEANCNLELSWINGLADTHSHVGEHTHDCDEIMFYCGNDYHKPHVLGAEIEYIMGGQLISFNTTSSIFIPKGVPHGAVIWKMYERPHIQMSLLIGADSHDEVTKSVDKNVPEKIADFDYEQYVIRSPIKEAGAELVRGRTAPTLTYLSTLQIPEMRNCVEFGWTFEMPLSQRNGSGRPLMVHRNYDEIVLHIGSDPTNPEMLGGDMEYWVGDTPLRFDTSSLIYIPMGLKHGPIKCLKYEKPHIVLAILLGAGSIKDCLEDSFSPP